MTNEKNMQSNAYKAKDNRLLFDLLVRWNNSKIRYVSANISSIAIVVRYILKFPPYKHLVESLEYTTLYVSVSIQML